MKPNKLEIQPEITILKSINFDYGVTELRSDNILTFEPHENITTLKTPQLKEMLEIMLDISEGIPRPYFSNNTNIKFLGAEEKIHISKTFHLFATACAMTENSAITRFKTHVFLQLSRPAIPVKMFKEKEDAYAWLRTFNKQFK